MIQESANNELLIVFFNSIHLNKILSNTRNKNLLKDLLKHTGSIFILKKKYENS